MGADAVFFDLDGCLVDSSEAIGSCMNHALDAVGVPAQPLEVLTPLIGPPLLGMFEQILTDLGADAGLARACIDHYRSVYGVVSLERTRVIAGMPALIEAVAARATVAVVTTKPAEFAEPILRVLGLDRWLRAVFAPRLDALHESKEASLRRALAWGGVGGGDHVWMVGDRRYDVEAGRACGVRTAGVTWGSGTRAELEAAGASVIVDSVAALGTVLDAS